MLSFSWGAFLVYVGALMFMVLGGLWGLYQSHHPAFLAPVLMGLFFFYLCWEAVVGREDDLSPPGRQR
ncbi:MAG: hypothetical protein IT304_07850 [Dehalococcoidia bacterium]|nr:hypothetical protein [Dehalococcoidia bacterium]